MNQTVKRINRSLPKRVRFIYGISLITIGVYSTLWSLVEPFDFKHPDLLVYFTLGLVLIILLADHFLNYYWFRHYPEKVISIEIETLLEEYLGLLHEVEEKKDIFKLNLLKWRIETEFDKIREIHSGKWILYALPRYGYLRYIFRSIIKTLQKGDTYDTLSNLDFWSRDKYGKEAEFLAENLDAVERGVTIRRIIIVDNAIFNPANEEQKRELENLLSIVNDFKIARAGDETGAFDKIELYFYLSQNYSEDASNPVPFAIISNKENNLSMAVEPYEKGSDKTPEIKVSFSEKSNSGMYKTSQNRFKNLFGRRRTFLSLDDIASRIEALPVTTKKSLGRLRRR